HPRNLVDAAHSLFYFVAASIVERKFDWDAMTVTKMRDPVIAAVQDRIVFDPDPPPLPDRFPHRHGGSVAILLKDGREFVSTCRAPRGSGARGIDWKDIDAKYRRLAPMSGMSPAQVDASLGLLRNFDELQD